MPQYSSSLTGLILSISHNWQLIRQMTKREVVGRYRGSFLGLAWSFFHPILMLVVYTFVFSVIFKAKWGVGGDESKSQFAIVLFVGLIVHGVFAEVINRAPGLILGNVNFVKKVVFPIEILPVVCLFAALFHSLISLLVLLIAFIIFNGFIHWTAIFLPLIFIPFILLILGGAWILASIGVFIRDVGQTIVIITTVLLFLSPVFFPIDALPANYHSLIMLNPLTFIIEQSRGVLIWGRVPDWFGLGIYSLVSVALAWAGYAWFQKTRRGFSDVL
ncbi:ABC transporter permease [Hahella aquimaris]|uniref:ABC transporter permease n=1 Tax=Hahella sp. HNIBRBA332 TaxID=3015983 RepID=UPI00273CB1FF|nr:ABC transporter permease [Hahella sp. HNIBRBA332]WLQ17386.1 ABC transporter permease [Hahella sp. HNIBRBA332]